MTGSRPLWLVFAFLLCVPAVTLADESAAGSREPAPVRETAGRFGLQLSSDDPIEISADQLEARRGDDGRDRVVFEHNVKLKQGDLRLECGWLEAIYPAGGGRPQQITARKKVRILKTGTEIRCGEAVFRDAECMATCSRAGGVATLRQGENQIEGEEILFDLCKGVLKVRQGRVELQPRRNEKSTQASLPPRASEPEVAPAPKSAGEGSP